MGETSITAILVPFKNPGWTQTDIIINLWPNCKLGFTLMLFVLLCKMWNVVKPGAWLARPLLGAQQSQDSPILSMVLQILHSQQTVTQSHSWPGQCPGRLEVRSEACFALSLKPKQDYLISLTPDLPLVRMISQLRSRVSPRSRAETGTQTSRFLVKVPFSFQRKHSSI